MHTDTPRPWSNTAVPAGECVCECVQAYGVASNTQVTLWVSGRGCHRTANHSALVYLTHNTHPGGAVPGSELQTLGS